MYDGSILKYLVSGLNYFAHNSENKLSTSEEGIALDEEIIFKGLIKEHLNDFKLILEDEIKYQELQLLKKKLSPRGDSFLTRTQNNK